MAYDRGVEEVKQIDLFSLPPNKEEKDHYNIYRMADHQIIRMVKKGLYVNYCKSVWWGRYKLPYPLYVDMGGRITNEATGQQVACSLKGRMNK
jgi:hypothetical protein